MLNCYIKVFKKKFYILIILIHCFSINLAAVSKEAVHDFFRRGLNTSIPSQLSLNNTTSLEAQLNAQKRIF